MKRSTVCAVAVLVGGLGQAQASGFLVARFGGEHGHPTTDNATAIYYNPAGLSLRAGTRLYLDGTFALRTASYERPESAISNPGTGTPTDATEANAGKAELMNMAGAPFIGVVSDLTVPNLGVGAALYVPIGGAAVWDSNDATFGPRYIGAEDGVQRWWAVEGTIRSMYGSLGAAYRFPDLRLSIGAGFNLVMTSIDTIRARNGDGSDDLIASATGTPKEGRTLLKADGIDLAFSAGVIWQPIEDWFVGLSYQSRPGITGDQRLEGKLDTYLPGSRSDAASSSDIDILQQLPDVIRFGVRGRPVEDMEVRLFGDYSRWSVFKRQCIVNRGADCDVDSRGRAEPGAEVILNIPREWQDAFGVRAGGSYWVLPELELILGGGFDGNAVPDKTMDPSLMDMNKVTASLGARYTMLDNALAIAGTFTQVIYFEREVDTDTYFTDSTCTPGGTDDGDKTNFCPPSRSPNGGGTYNQSVTVFNLNVEYAF